MVAGQTSADAAEVLLRRLWLEDGQSFKQIAQALTEVTGKAVTRGAVAGRVRRLGLTGMQAARPSEAAVTVSPSAPSDEVEKSDTAAVPAPTYTLGTWPMAATTAGQCKFACTPHTARPEQHRFCGEPVAWRGGKPTSWCRVHLDVVSGATGRTPGGASVANVANGQVRPDREPARSGWGATGA
ncbi:GcrA family cell cycle regulator [Methylobacterium sp. C1]|uniref:GcrA family cell cycle regulator n=1 Tax=Methylobacterium sp. C1 TaxID=1479019 RepID=UPI0008DB2C11|nr:GcrA family cell cycle regulator [Methylobacterium sp. C1]